uniref:Uncharacterized protein n=1 Tax=Mycena chlorophos TaxID=658473 RepID=A0ABQ0LWH0_MYCCL|nr:predicted protein [Mycena chlorophos]
MSRPQLIQRRSLLETPDPRQRCRVDQVAKPTVGSWPPALGSISDAMHRVVVVDATTSSASSRSLSELPTNSRRPLAFRHRPTADAWKGASDLLGPYFTSRSLASTSRPLRRMPAAVLRSRHFQPWRKRRNTRSLSYAARSGALARFGAYATPTRATSRQQPRKRWPYSTGANDYGHGGPFGSGNRQVRRFSPLEHVSRGTAAKRRAPCIHSTIETRLDAKLAATTTTSQRLEDAGMVPDGMLNTCNAQLGIRRRHWLTPFPLLPMRTKHHPARP